MTDKKPQPPQPQPPQLTEKQRVGQQVEATDMTYVASEALSALSPFGGTVRFFGKTDFEGHQLNQMIDLVENANPEHLASAGDALFAAQKAINDAASELDGHIGNVEWEGKSGDAFRTWGKKLVGHAQDLAKFADTAGVQISAAGEGLTFVRHAMPPRDHRAEPVKVADIPSAKRVAGNAEYEAAVKVEKDRQEAINQMNRLSSFYSVSEQTLAAQQPPVFEAMPKVGVPDPDPNYGKVSPGSETPSEMGTHHYSADAGTPSRHPATEATPARSQVDGVAGPSHPASDVVPPRGPVPDGAVTTDLTSVAPAPPAMHQAPTAIPPTVSTTGPSGSPVLPPVGGLWTPTSSGGVKAPGGMNEPFAARRTAGGSADGAGRAVASPMGRSGTTGQIAGRGVTSAGQMPAGRGVTGGTPRPIGTSSSRPGSAAGRGQSIVGGRPNTTTGSSAGSRMPRSTVVGGEQPTASAKSAARPGQRGVVGAQDRTPSDGTQNNRRPLSSPDGVVGTPQGRATSARAARNGFTSGGAGLVRGSGNQQSTRDEEEEAARRPDYLVEDEETHLPSRSGNVPPVIN
ncbi:hypothetical protein [Streptomyces violascens]|uniref:hypothetical protein n=1 Tax=Streptomyces violascens TaxID=67381 RepID=UPI0036C1E2A0